VATGDPTVLEPGALVRRAVEVARLDLEVGGATGFRPSVAPEPGDDSFWMVFLGQGGQGSGLGVSIEGESFVSVLATVADRLQDVYIDHLWEARPRCPVHEHPLSACELDGEAVWICPGESGWKRPIGSLATDLGYIAAVGHPPGP
jgi:hypothetical protein